ncbi:uncharacterized protein N0V89_009209 [Didymosphaeria variabile]|uniref:Mid2 domain-containing protein n=1 Tax=Didymosphaeria variabile TaxID=1932322 RepID=A0A9W8XDX2_9PLEO|nr:uncharacterized protein N0V89_009209 [Didymosphaeria variabile]KAJ4347839.1 hypothetical protein N0V89_009209 [Didymosphaeria variabile]
MSKDIPSYGNMSLYSRQCTSEFYETEVLTLTYDNLSEIITTDTAGVVTTSKHSRPTVLTTIMTYGMKVVPPIYVDYRSGDFPITSGPSTSSPTQTVSTVTSAVAGQTSSGSAMPSGLSTGAKAGIGVGISTLVVLLSVGALLWRRRAQKAKAGLEDPNGSGGWAKAELGAEERNKAELEAQEQHRQPDVFHELHGNSQPKEMG